jgi:hypothetical protein
MNELWLQASEAHATLSDAAKRREYNHTSHAEYVRWRKMALISEQERLARRGTSAGVQVLVLQLAMWIVLSICESYISVDPPLFWCCVDGFVCDFRVQLNLIRWLVQVHVAVRAVVVV